jgi:GNAT superfamily N-acetyltransferase
MLADAPQAFGEPLATAQARTEAEWKQLAEELADTARACAFIAEDESGQCGYVHGDSTEPQLPPGSVLAGQLWVAPRQRGTGLGRRLMEAVTDWAVAFGAEQIVLGVLKTNLEVLKYYERLDYKDLGMRIPLPHDPTNFILVMGRKLKL